MKAEDDREDYLLFGVSVSRLVSKPVNGVSSYTARYHVRTRHRI